jgi:hypothetical protein
VVSATGRRMPPLCASGRSILIVQTADFWDGLTPRSCARVAYIWGTSSVLTKDAEAICARGSMKNCGSTVRRALMAVPGVVNVQVSLEEKVGAAR